MSSILLESIKTIWFLKKSLQTYTSIIKLLITNVNIALIMLNLLYVLAL